VYDELAFVDFCTGHGEPVERLQSDDPELIAYVSQAEPDRP
jgi:hypothetical protein